nr:immunoglobulin light chain junction region [Macaca mulatta]MOV77915.1 immunoglobulin light chain junction region [Macaca mulatta]
CQQYDNFPYSF